MGKIVPSEYQEKIFDFIKNGVGNAVIEAKAGSGKTTTMVEGIKYVPANQNALFVAFNKSICQELEKKLEGVDNVKVRTYHSLGFQFLRENLGITVENVKEYKYSAYINKNITSICPDCKFLKKSKLKQYKTNLKQLVDYARYNLAQSPEEIMALCSKYGVDIVYNECEIVPVILEWGVSYVKEIDYADMVWIPIERGLETRYNKFDFIFIDEAQDSSKMQQALIKKCFKRGGRFIAVGDEFQCINAFAGADEEAFKMFKKEPNTKTFILPISYRCPQKIVEKAQNIIGCEDIIAAPNAIDGVIIYDVSPYDPKNGDLVLCRNTAPLMKLHAKFTAGNKKCYIKGRSIADRFKEMVESVGKERIALDMTCDGIFPRLYENLFEAIEKDMEMNGLEYGEVVNTRKITELIDIINSLEILAQGMTWKDELLDKIDVIFSDDSEEGICLSTIHKAKGLEAENVYILCPSLMPSSHAKQKWEIIQEENLMYVAVTRTKNKLCYISEKDFPAKMFDNIDIIAELEYKRKRMSRALNIMYMPMQGDSGKTMQEEITDDVERIMNINKTGERIINEKKRDRIGGNKFSKFLK